MRFFSFGSIASWLVATLAANGYLFSILVYTSILFASNGTNDRIRAEDATKKRRTMIDAMVHGGCLLGREQV